MPSLYLALLQVGFSSIPIHTGTWCALTAPFHPCLCPPKADHRRYGFCGTFRRLATPGRYPAPCPLESGLSSPIDRGDHLALLAHGIMSRFRDDLDLPVLHDNPADQRPEHLLALGCFEVFPGVAELV
jgi:hypothetical protein